MVMTPDDFQQEVDKTQSAKDNANKEQVTKQSLDTAKAQVIDAMVQSTKANMNHREKTTTKTTMYSEQVAKFNSIIQNTMELWRIYRFVRCADNEIKKHNPSIIHILEVYSKKTGFDTTRTSEIYQSAIGRQYIAAPGTNITITPYKGRELLEMKGLGFINELLKQHNALIAFLTGGLINLVVIALIKLIQIVIRAF